MDRDLAKNIIATITYYDVLSYPLTSFEIWKHLIKVSGDGTKSKWSLVDVVRYLKKKSVAEYVAEKNGFYFLHGREEVVALRRRREFISIRKIKKLKWIVSILRYSPFVRMMCVTGRLSYKNCERESDLDLLVAYEHGHIWTGRFFLTAFAHVLGMRRYGEKINDRACLNYHITTQSLCVPTQDLFAAHEYSFIYPLYDAGGHFSRFCKENEWIVTYKPHYSCEHKKHAATVGDGPFGKIIKAVWEYVFSDRGTEDRLRKLQRPRIQNNPKTKEEGALILYSDQYLVFLPKPQGPNVFEKYKKRFEALEIGF